MTISESEFTRQNLRTAVAQVCQAIGWNSIHQTPLSIMVDILHKYILKIGRTSQNYAELCGRTDSNISDLASTFGQMGVDLNDLEEYVQHFEVNPVREVPKYPTEGKDQLCFLKPGSREVLQRPIHIYDYLPPMYPEMEEDIPSPPPTLADEESKSSITSIPGNHRNPKLPPGPQENGKSSDDNCPLREISSVMMTSSGFLSPCREGKLADSRTPHQVPDPEEKKQTAKRALDVKTEEKEKTPESLIEPVKIKQEIVEDYEDISVQPTPPAPAPPVKEEPKKLRFTSANLDQVISTVIERGVRESDKLPAQKLTPHQTPSRPASKQAVNKDATKQTPVSKSIPALKPAQSKTTPAQKPKLQVKDLVSKEPEKEPERGGEKRKRKNNKRLGSPHSAIPDSAPRHLGAPKPPKMPRIPKITDTDIKLPTPASLGIGSLGGFPPGLIPGGNPLLPGSLYGFGIPASHLIPGLNPLINPGFIPPTVDEDIAADSELEEGEVSPPRSDIPPGINLEGLSPSLSIINISKMKKEAQEVDKSKEKEKEKEREREKEKEREKERARQAEKAKEKEREREREREREKERERQREAEKAAKEREKEIARERERERERKKEEEKEKEREKEREREREREKEREREREREKELEKEKEREKSKEKEKSTAEKKEKVEKEKKKSKKEKKDKDKDKEKSKKKEKKEKKEKKKSKDKEKKIKSGGARIFNPEEGAVPKIKIKAVSSKGSTPEPTNSTKLVIKNLVKDADTPGPSKDPSASKESSVSKANPTPSRGRPPKSKEEKPGKRSKRPPEISDSGSRGRKHREPRKQKTRESIDDDDDEPSSGIITETVGSYTDEAGNMVWICPACGKQDDGSPMIGCDQCDDWYHWLCVGINREPQMNQDWFCTRCIAKKGGIYLDRKGGKKKS